jgi:hypothetical protein
LIAWPPSSTCSVGERTALGRVDHAVDRRLSAVGLPSGRTRRSRSRSCPPSRRRPRGVIRADDACDVGEPGDAHEHRPDRPRAADAVGELAGAGPEGRSGRTRRPARENGFATGRRALRVGVGKREVVRVRLRPPARPRGLPTRPEATQPPTTIRRCAIVQRCQLQLGSYQSGAWEFFTFRKLARREIEEEWCAQRKYSREVQDVRVY